MNTPATTKSQVPATSGPHDDIGLLPEEIRLPIVGIIQEKNHLLDQSEKYEIGQLVDFSTGEIISRKNDDGINALKFVPIHVKRVWIAKNPRTRDSKMFDSNFEPNALIFKTENPADPRIMEEEQLAKDRDAVPRVKKYLQYLCYIEGQDMPAIISFGKSSKVAGEQLLTKIQFAKQGPGKVDMWKRKYQLTSVPATYQDHNFFKLNFERIDDPTEAELETTQCWANTIAKQNYQPDVEVDDDPEDTSAPQQSAPAQSQPATEAPY